ncbi:MAG: hypothetical protein E7560_06475 [Ruminococcaceae bacterium]|nr:hypothetical protein [Oscillospiraceae bacterium]
MTIFKRVFAIVLLLCWMTLIFCLSAQPADVSSGTSGRIIKVVVSVVYPEFNDFSAEEQAEFIEPFQFITRKCAHFSLYFILGIFAFLTFVTYNKLALIIRSYFSIFICLLYAFSDEIHQYFIPGRSCEIRDVLIDFAGSISSIAILYFIVSLKNHKKGKRKMRKKELFRLNEELFEKAEKYKLLYADLKQENDSLKAEIESLKSEIESLKKPSEPMKALEEKIIIQANITDDTRFGAEIIGKIVVEAAKHCNALTSSGGNENKELVNLILGRTEIAKAEILKIVSLDLPLEEKKEKIISEQKSAEDYFLSVIAQKE